jgi:hypothetical protein
MVKVTNFYNKNNVILDNFSNLNFTVVHENNSLVYQKRFF